MLSNLPQSVYIAPIIFFKRYKRYFRPTGWRNLGHHKSNSYKFGPNRPTPFLPRPPQSLRSHPWPQHSLPPYFGVIFSASVVRLGWLFPLVWLGSFLGFFNFFLVFWFGSSLQTGWLLLVWDLWSDYEFFQISSKKWVSVIWFCHLVCLVFFSFLVVFLLLLLGLWMASA